MGKENNQIVYAQSAATTQTNFPWIDTRDPTSYDTNYAIGKFWVNTLNDTLWYLNSLSSTNALLQAQWITLISNLSTLSDTLNDIVDPSSGVSTPPNNIQLYGTPGQIDIVADPGNNRLVFTLSGGGTAIDQVQVQENTLPGVNPVDADTNGLMTVSGALVASHGVPLETRSRALNSYNIEIQISDISAAPNSTLNGVSHFDSAAFTVDADGFVSLTGSGAATTDVMVDVFTGPGTNPVVPSGTGVITITGDQVASATVGANVIQTNSLAANTFAIEIQRTGSSAISDSTLNGVSHFDSANFTVNADGFVSLAGGGLAIDSVALQTGTSPITPNGAGQITLNGAVVAAGTNPVRSDGTGANTAAIEVQISQAIAAADPTKIGLANFNSANFTVNADGFVSLSVGGSISNAALSVAMTANISKTITSISLTPGTWDISANFVSESDGTTGYITGSISTVNNTHQGAFGNGLMQMNGAAVFGHMCVTVAQFRKVIASTQTQYAVIQANGGTLKGSAGLFATRVG